MFIYIIYPHNVTDLKAFLQFITGCGIPIEKIVVAFVSHANSEAIAAKTCGRQITLSSLIKDEDLFITGLLAIIPGRCYTMP